MRAVDDLLAQAPLIDEPNDIRLDRIVREERLSLLHEHDVPPSGRHERLTHLAGFERECNILKLFQCLSLADPRQFSAVGCRSFVVRQTACFGCEVGTFEQCLIDRIDAQLGPSLLIWRGLLLHQRQDMSNLDESSVADGSGFRLLINSACLSLHVCIGDHGRTDLLVAIARKLVLERLHRV